jgi:hypothetical protein
MKKLYCSSGTVMQALASSANYGGMARACSSHPPRVNSPPPANPQNVEESEDVDDE